ncbi:MAG: redoxin domain-containing protein [Sphingobacteriales bacterium]|uniref:TlpA disulfide reductase family protein n=1 Tax=Hydrotalea flava TaxID=714549 RepID=UPI00082CE512|nr:TlpA disulfide reductase family protein [Hydrotalea flava]RTL55516.1 MAG: redoxin domain-containing protein [Sphingobacteriales bacterium]
MKKLICCLGIITVGILHAQNVVLPFILNGYINSDTGSVRLILTGDSSNYLPIQYLTTGKVKNGQFSFSGVLSYPLSFRLLFLGNKEYVSDLFYIDAGTQTIICNVDSIREIPAMNNATMQELIQFKQQHYTSETIQVYIKKHPASYMAMWQLARMLSFNYNPNLDTAYSYLSDAVKMSYTGIRLGEKLKAAAVLSLNHIFPNLTLLDMWKNPTQLFNQKKINQFTLIDFWFSHCNPCIEQFPQFIQIYHKYKNINFNMIGISVDNTKDIGNWIKMIGKYQLPWQQLLDTNGFQALKLSINTYPRNFLLDSHHVIIQKDITPEALNNFLAEKMTEHKSSFSNVP